MSKKEKVILAIGIIFIILLIIMIIWYAKTHKKPAPLPTTQQGNMVLDLSATDEDRQNENPLADRQVYFAGIEDAVLYTDGQIALENLPENKEFVLKYIVTNNDTGEQIFETDLIPSGKKVYWTPGEQLKPGDYNIAFTEMPYAPDATGENYTPLTQGKNVIKLTIVEK